MTRTILFSIVALMTTGLSQADANPHNARYRHLDDLAFTAYVDARELRWEIHDDFVTSADYNHLLRDTDAILSCLRSVQASIHAERHDSTIAREVERTFDRIANLRQHLEGCDFARVRASRFHSIHRGRGYGYTPETRHVGRVHVDTALQLVARVEQALDQLAREVGCHSRLRHPPAPAFIPQAPALPPVPRQTHFRQHNSRTRPVFTERVGGVTFSFGF